MMNFDQAKEKYDLLKEKEQALKYALTLANWDISTLSPKKGKPYAAKAMGVLDGEMFELITSKETQEILDVFQAHSDQLSQTEKREVELRLEDLDRLSKIPQKEYQEYSELQAITQIIWEDAKEKQDYSMFAPNLEKIIDFKKRFANYIDPQKNPYDICLDDFEKGLTSQTLDVFFSAVKEKSVPLLKRILNEGRSLNNDFHYLNYDVKKQEEISYKVLDMMHFDLDAGILAASEHPFTTEINNGDVRLTTHYFANNMPSAIFSTIHEAGHGLYEQHAKASPLLEGSSLKAGVSMGIHESQSRFYENILGRSHAFWEYLYPTLQKTFSEQLKDVSLDDFYASVNVVKPSLIRIEADELTYNLHIMIRYELEKDLIEGRLSVDDLPKRWCEKYEEYLGVTPPNVSKGVLQDVHWSGGMIGYFPSYALGNAYAAQLLHTMKKTVDVDAACRKGDLTPINDWLFEHIHQYGMLKKPEELIVAATGEKLNPRYLTDYFEEKYSKLYF